MNNNAARADANTKARTYPGSQNLSDSKAASINSFIITRHQRTVLIVALTLTTLLKIYLALVSRETTDSYAFLEFLNHIRDAGGTSIYYFRGSYNNPFNFPAGMIHFIRALGFFADTSGLPFQFWLKSVSSLADVGSFFIVWHLIQPRKDLFRLMALLALCPVSIVINGLAGNVDGLMIFLVLLSIWLIETRKPIWIAGIVLGIALNIKVAPLIIVPAMLLFLPNLRSRLVYGAWVVATFVICSLPFIVQDPVAIKRAVFDYGSIYGAWGLTKLAVLLYGKPPMVHPPYDPIGGHAIFAAVLKYFMFGVICTVSLWMNLRNTKPRLLVQCGTVVGLFLFLTPGFGAQYLVWLVPFVLAAGLRATLIYYGITTFWFIGPALGSLVGIPRSVNFYTAVLFACWISALIAVVEFHRSAASETSHLTDYGTASIVTPSLS